MFTQKNTSEIGFRTSSFALAVFFANPLSKLQLDAEMFYWKK